MNSASGVFVQDSFGVSRGTATRVSWLPLCTTSLQIAKQIMITTCDTLHDEILKISYKAFTVGFEIVQWHTSQRYLPLKAMPLDRTSLVSVFPSSNPEHQSHFLYA
jgi:hypothetical protein